MVSIKCIFRLIKNEIFLVLLIDFIGLYDRRSQVINTGLFNKYMVVSFLHSVNFSHNANLSFLVTDSIFNSDVMTFCENSAIIAYIGCVKRQRSASSYCRFMTTLCHRFGKRSTCDRVN